MALSFLSGSGSGSSVKYFDIRLDEDYIVFRGNEHEAASAHLKGTLVFCVTEPLTIKHVKLTLSGISRISWGNPTTAGGVGYTHRAKKEVNFFEKTWTFRDPGRGKTETLMPDNYEYAFDLVLDGGLPESIEGLPESWIIYRFKADIGRKYAKDVQARKPLRIIRTLGPSALETAHEMSVENIWPNKIEYTIGTPAKAVVFGTSITVNFRLVSLLKGLRIGLCSTEILETHEFSIEQDGSTPERKRKDTRIIAADQYTVDMNNPEILDEQAEGYQFARFLELPKTLKKCVQDADIHGIKIRHKLKFNVALHNPDGHVSELRATLPISLYISPSIEINENNDLVDQSPVASRQAVADDPTNSAPPLYGQHQFDQYYSEMDHSGYRTPGNFSAPGTPFGSLSRNISTENLNSLMRSSNIDSALVENPGTNGNAGSALSPVALQHRLQNLRVLSVIPSPLVTEEHHSGQNTESANSRRHSSNPSGDYFLAGADGSGPHSHGHSPNPSLGLQTGDDNPHSNGPTTREGSADLSRPSSGEEHPGAQTPAPQFHEIEDLARIPSYSTAVRTPARTPYNGPDLPSYGAATSSSRGQSPPGRLSEPPMAYLRSSRY